MKRCFKCGIEKDLDLFYVAKGMLDGRLNKCIECVKEYEKNRRQDPRFRKKILDYDKKRGSRRTAEDTRKYRDKYPNKYKAHCIVNNAIRDKKLFKQSCEVCGTDYSVHAHHDDYLKPLNVRWLCAEHHKKWHIENGESLNSV